MKKNLLLIASFTLIVLSVPAQDTIKVNFKPSGTVGDIAWDSILVADKAAYESGYSIFSAFGGNVMVKPVWQTEPIDKNVRAVDRNNGDFQYTGQYAEVLRSYIAVDSRYDNNCNIIGIEIIGLPKGKYTFESYHHDFNDQHGSFTASTSINGTVVDGDGTNEMMISHSMDSVEYNDRYPDNVLDSAEAVEFQKHYVTNSLDSVTKYSFDQIVSSGPSDIVLVSFKNVLQPDPVMSHYVKFIVINGFKLYETKTVETNIDDLTSNSVSVYPNPVSEILKVDLPSGNIQELSYSVVDITGKTVLMNTGQLIDNHIELDISKLSKGSYFFKLSLKEGPIIRKFIVM